MFCSDAPRGGLAARLLSTMALAFFATTASGQPQHQDVNKNPSSASPLRIAPVLSRYCTTCHSSNLKAAGLVIDPRDVSAEFLDAEHWEKVIRKLRNGSMPPPGMPRPDAETSARVAAFLERKIDIAAASKPRAGTLPAMHRLTRTEYQNAIRDLLTLESLPKEMDYSFLLPADNASSGFDNIADLLFISAPTMERYLSAAQKISALAVGDPATPVMVNIHRVSEEQPQTSTVDGLPVGTRGGLAVKTDLPLDGEYAIKLQLVGPQRVSEQIEISINGERIQVISTDPQPKAGPKSAKLVETRVHLNAGPAVVGIAFVQRNETRDEETLRPRMRGRGPDLAVESATISGPYHPNGSGDTPSRRRIFVCRPAPGENDSPCVNKILSTLAKRAYRRPVMATDVERLLPFYKAGRSEGGFEQGIQRAIERILVSPQFLYRIEYSPAALARGSLYAISDVELASRLSFFLWSSIPDDDLLNTAIEGRLSQPAVLDAQVSRMLRDERAKSLVSNFAEQWLYLRDIEAKKPDLLLFPDFDETLRAAFRTETNLFLSSILLENRSVLDLLTANHTFVNERLAKHYGIPHIQGSYFRRVNLPPESERGGLLGQGSILTITSYATRTSPVVRGKWVLENLLSSAPPPPPPNIPALKTESTKTGKALSMRAAMLEHRANPACASCHARMDPIGFAMENFDAVGRWRDRDDGKPIDASGSFPDGVKFEGLAGLKKVLLLHPEEFVNTAAEKLLMYALGRNIQYYDRPALRKIVREAARDKYTLRALIMGVVKSTPFRMREAAAIHINDTKPGGAR